MTVLGKVHSSSGFDKSKRPGYLQFLWSLVIIVRYWKGWEDAGVLYPENYPLFALLEKHCVCQRPTKSA